MIIEIRGAEFVNKGAELMLYAILEKIRSQYHNATIVMPYRSRSPLKKLKELGINVRIRSKKHHNIANLINDYIPKYILNNLGFIKEGQINVIVDASGFAYGDQWGADKVKKRISNKIESYKKSGVKVIFLPQAFGPFENIKLKFEMEKIINNADLIFARDQISYDHLISVSNSANTSDKIKLSPDFTNLVDGFLPKYYNQNVHDISIIPNYKMLTHGKNNTVEYLNFLKSSIDVIKKNGGKPYFLIHEGKYDVKISEEVNNLIDVKIPIIKEEDPIKVKGLIGKSRVVITSRFHGLVSALSQGVPCFATEWSHKYEMLLKDYDHLDGLCSVVDIKKLERKLIDLLTSEFKIKKVRKKLKNKAEEQKQKSKEMWEKTFEVISEINEN